MNEVNKTLYIPLYGKAYVSSKGIILHDPKAEEIWGREGFALKGKSKSKWLAYYMGMRSAVFDGWVNEMLVHAEDAVVLHPGCGMDSRAIRINAPYKKWYDIDFPEVIAERRRYYEESGNYRMVASDIRKKSWLEDIPEKECAIIVMEGISMYIKSDELKSLTENFCAHFGKVYILMDCYSTFAAKMSKYKNPINDVGVTQVCGMDDATMLENGTLKFVKEHNMTPDEYISQLSIVEKYIFRKLYAGKTAKKMYRIYEYGS